MPVFQSKATDYDCWFDRHPHLFQSELAAIRLVLPSFEKGMEIGVGTGRFAAALGIRYGLEPLEDFAKIARSRGIEVVKGIAEKLPYPDASFDLVLMVTVDCFLDDVPEAFGEAHRVLKPGGSLVVAFLDKNGVFAKKYEQSGKDAYKNARFHSPEEIVGWMTGAGFADFQLAQTLFCGDEVSEVEKPGDGVGKGSFAIVLGKKRDKPCTIKTSRKRISCTMGSFLRFHASSRLSRLHNRIRTKDTMNSFSCKKAKASIGWKWTATGLRRPSFIS